MNTINFKNLTISGQVSNEQDGNYITYTKDGVTKRYDLLEITIGVRSHILKISYNITTSFAEESFVQRGRDIISHNTYDRFYNIQPDEKTGSTVHKASLNAIAEEIFGNGCILFNPANDFKNIQPVTYDIETTPTGAIISVIDKPKKGALAYTFNDPLNIETVWKSIPKKEIPLTAGEHTISIVNKNDQYPFSQLIFIGHA